MTTLSIGLMLSMLAIAGLFAGGITMTPAVYADDDEESTEIETEIKNEAESKAEAENEDNDVVVQENDADVAQIGGDQSCSSGAAVTDDDFIGVTGANVAVAANDCDNINTQTATVTQANANVDNDVQIADADSRAEAEQTLCGQLAFLGLQLCDNEVEALED